MVSTNELITLISQFSLAERLKIVEGILRGIREENDVVPVDKHEHSTEAPRILELAGVMSEEEAAAYNKAVEESRKVDKGE